MLQTSAWPSVSYTRWHGALETESTDLLAYNKNSPAQGTLTPPTFISVKSQITAPSSNSFLGFQEHHLPTQYIFRIFPKCKPVIAKENRQ